ncbi:FecR domain-containing protein [uncultured Alistipes sp.]|uniref:FecR family protein n=1 Tax=uncultured Alistipes sp. TaxID=538949 RepID=UPI0025EEEECD|nr:FecR domain-containing protein [uncultured Alistipes sp.]
MSKQQRKQIIDYIFNNPNVPEDIRRHFEQWILTQENDAQVNEILQEMWDKHAAYATDEENSQGLERLHAAIRPNNVRMLARRILRYAGVAAAIVLVFIGGYYSASKATSASEKIMLLTAKGNVGEFTLPDGTRVWLNGESRLKYPADFAGKAREVSLSGEAFFEVTKDSLRPFKVNMTGLQVEVLGTSFDAMSYSFGSNQEIVLKSGSVKVSGSDLAKPVLLKPDERFALNRRTKQVSIETVDADNYCRWFESRLVFDNTPLRDIITNLERRYNIEISLSPQIQVDRRLSMVVYHEPLEDIMEVMSSLISIRYRIEGNHVLITRK